MALVIFLVMRMIHNIVYSCFKLVESQFIGASGLQGLLKDSALSHYPAGTKAWWEDVRTTGLPLITTQDDQTCRVVFIWQDSQGNERESIIASVLLNVNALTDNHSWTPNCLQRVRGTDVWMAQLNVDSSWRGSYSFIPLAKHQLPEIVRNASDGSRVAQRNWWIDVARNQTFDPLNKFPVLQSGWGVSSPLHLPNAPRELGWKEWELGHVEAVTADQMQTIHWESLGLGNQRECWLFSTAHGAAPLVILLDGQQWGVASGALSVLRYLTDAAKIAPAHYLLISSIDGNTRWKELSCYRPFWSAVIDDLLPKVQSELSKENKDINEFLVVGQSLGGLSALYAGVTFPEYFPKVISLSGSFWWPDTGFIMDPDASTALDFVPENSLAEQIAQEQVSVSHLKIYQNVGAGEKDMCRYNDATYQALTKKGANVHFELFCGGHDWLSWRSGLVNGLLHLIPAIIES